MTATRDFIDEVKRRTDVVEVIGADVALKPCGKVLKGLSPFHAEKDPSFVVWPGTQSWHDFSNGGSRGGDVIAYLMEARGLAFKEALHEVAERAGLRHPEQNDEEYANELARIAERRELETRLTQAAVYYHRKLPTKIRERYHEQHYGFTSETIAALQLGWADGHLYDYFREHLGLSRVAALKTGLFVQRPTGGVENYLPRPARVPVLEAGQGRLLHRC
jgi:DNA primase